MQGVQVCCADDLCRFERPATSENGQAGEQLLLIGVQQLVRPLDGCSQRLLARIDSAAGPEQVEPPCQTLE